jgi:hypothetical protein
MKKVWCFRDPENEKRRAVSEEHRAARLRFCYF